MAEKNVDVLINVFGKPHQTALSLLTLLRHCDARIRRIHFQEEAATAEYETKGHAPLLRYLGERVAHFQPSIWLGSTAVDEARLLADAEYRRSVRYQYGWEKSDAPYVFTVHNDVYVHGDIIGALLGAIGEHTGIGQIGQCWWCPARQNSLCSPEQYAEFRPSYAFLMRLYNKDMDYTKRRAYNLGLRPEFHENAWPLPECRLSEWAALINMEKARPATMPFGPAVPLGAFCVSGAKIGENWDRDVNLDTGVGWFRSMNLQGHSFAHYPIHDYLEHPKTGRDNLESPERYITAEVKALARLREEFSEYAGSL